MQSTVERKKSHYRVCCANPPTADCDCANAYERAMAAFKRFQDSNHQVRRGFPGLPRWRVCRCRGRHVLNDEIHTNGEPLVGVKLRRERCWTPPGETPARNSIAPPDGNQSRLFLSNEKPSFLGDLAACSRAAPFPLPGVR